MTFASDDKAKIEDKIKVLSDASSKMAERVYAKKSAEAGASSENTEAKDASDAKEGVVDAEFEEVKDEKEDK